jgi:hypothetical protein
VASGKWEQLVDERPKTPGLEVSEGSRYMVRSSGITARALDDQVVVLDLETSLYLNVTGAGAVVWPLLVAGTTLDAMVDAVLEVYDVEPDVARADLLTFLADLGERKLLR